MALALSLIFRLILCRAFFFTVRADKVDDDGDNYGYDREDVYQCSGDGAYNDAVNQPQRNGGQIEQLYQLWTTEPESDNGENGAKGRQKTDNAVPPDEGRREGQNAENDRYRNM